MTGWQPEKAAVPGKPPSGGTSAYSPPLHHMPADCWICKRRATSTGQGDGSNPKFLCEECLADVQYTSKVTRLDFYEQDALNDCVTEVGKYCDEIKLTDLAEFDEFQAVRLCKRVLLEFGASMRRQIRSGKAPF